MKEPLVIEIIRYQDNYAKILKKVTSFQITFSKCRCWSSSNRHGATLFTYHYLKFTTMLPR
jgi:hypothetical protein